MLAERTVFVIDDDATVRASVCALVSSMQHRAAAFASAEEFLATYAPKARGVIVTDLRMPGMGGLELQEELLRRDYRLPLIVLTAHARTPITVRAMQAGAVTMIDKPYHDDELWGAIRSALEKEEAIWTAEQSISEIRARMASLTTEESRVADLLIAGWPNKRVAQELQIALRTVEKRRHEVLLKMKAGSIAELTRMLLTAGLGGSA